MVIVEHLDLSYAAFDQIAIRHRGVVDLKFRPASCKDQGKSCRIINTKDGAKQKKEHQSKEEVYITQLYE